MGLEDIAVIAEDGCLLNLSENKAGKKFIHVTLEKRLRILEQHISKLDLHMKQLESVKAVAQKKMAFYSELIQE